MGDTWSERPYVQGGVLIGDAAGYSDPIIGQGLTVAVRDARLVGDALLGEPRWGPDIFEPYARERAERMRRLPATAEVMTRLRADFTREGHRRRDAAFARFAADPAESTGGRHPASPRSERSKQHPHIRAVGVCVCSESPLGRS